MNVALRTPTMTRDTFLDWAEMQGERYEFDGFQPVAMAGGSANHSQFYVDVDLPADRAEPASPG